MTNPLFKRDGATGKVHYYYNSHFGQPLKLFDKAGKITWAARSQAFGQTTVFVNETQNNLRFPGQYEDGETGLFYNHHRYYDPTTGLYIQEDPMGIAAGLNWYAYGFNNPLHWVDPLGLLCLPSWAKGALAGAAGGLIGGFVSGGFHGAIAGALFGAVGGGIQGGLGKAAQALGESVAAAYEKDVPKGGRYHAGRGALLGAAAGAVSNDALGPHGSQALAGFVGGTFGNPAKAFYAGPLGALGGAAGSFVESRIGDLLDEYASDCDEDKDKGDC